MDELTHRSFHRILPGRWWHPFLETAVFTGISLLFIAGFTLAAGLALGGDVIDSLEDMSQPAPFAVELGYIIVLGLAACLTASVCRRGKSVSAELRGARGLWSVTGRVRWAIASQAVLPAVICWAVFYIPVMAVEGGSPRWDSTAAALLGLTMALVPLQALSEELIFRSLIPQWIGRWVRSPWLVYLPGGGLFIAGHIYDAKGLAAIAVFAVAASVLTWYTGGIEAAAMVHIVGNLGAFSAAAIGIADPNAVEISWATVAAEVGFTVGATAWILYRVRRRPELVRSSPVVLPCGQRERSATGEVPPPPTVQRPPQPAPRPGLPE